MFKCSSSLEKSPEIVKQVDYAVLVKLGNYNTCLHMKRRNGDIPQFLTGTSTQPFCGTSDFL